MSNDEFIKRASKTITKKSEIPETNIEADYVKYAKKRGCKALKLILLFKKGFPDRTTLCPNARLFFIEFKRKGKPSTPPQIAVRKVLISFGFEYHVCDKPGQAENILDEFLDGL